ncbi:MAG: VCBS repeat-containing protein [Bacteroidota bacterium]
MNDRTSFWKPSLLSLIVSIFLCASLDIACVPDARPSNGEALARVHCGSCHMFPEPDLLPSSIWKEQVLPLMGEYLGIDDPSVTPIKDQSLEAQYNIAKTGLFPKTPKISEQEWRAIQQYFIEHAPDSILPQNLPVNIHKELPGFQTKAVQFSLPGGGMTAFVKYDSFAHRIWASDGRNLLFELDNTGKILSSQQTPSPVVDAIFRPEGAYNWLTIGGILPNDREQGVLWAADHTANFDPLIDKLGRPVDVAVADLNQDGKEDIVLSNFGNHAGQLVWYAGQDNGTYEAHVLSPFPGATRTEIVDMNQDGKLDIIVLMGQGNEGIFAYLNQGENRFKQQVLLRFPPLFGSSYFELLDMDNDGDLDILYTNGDNADYSFCYKSYHGVRIFLNDGEWNFEQCYFAPVLGATKAIGRDFDQDGQIEIALIAFFTDMHAEGQGGFLYFDNQEMSNLWNFETTSFLAAQDGRWLVMDAADIDEDGDEDILLGSFIFSASPSPPELVKRWQNNPLNLMILERK